ncbi:hypothetical protein T459_27314 [Capsicum annuum]|uniref:Uncharacterized protein n=1 Tax=Capsicum annuum TaxID=4072 RepID=A0A2G2YDK6_CAPAN|nr:hypothetical protein FXO37_24078 [Capsicum annuum]PHT67827.1 hypothetical protein T459_27314 [Capsicum annuum]
MFPMITLWCWRKILKNCTRATMLKKRFANIIIKSEQIISCKDFEEEKMKKKKEDWEKQFQELEKGKLMRQRQREREAARITVQSIKRTVEFDDGLKAEREFLMMISAV